MEVITTPIHWDCECKYNYIHPKTLHHCPKCDVFQDDQPDSILSEVVNLKQGLINCLYNDLLILQDKDFQIDKHSIAYSIDMLERLAYIEGVSLELEDKCITCDTPVPEGCWGLCRVCEMEEQLTQTRPIMECL
jgi:hypothetical protein